MKQLILVRGLPGSGKSTLAKKLRDCMITTDFAIHLEADMFFETDNGYQFDASKIKDAHAWCQQTTKDHLGFDSVVIVSNTFTTKWEMEPYFQIAKDYGITPVVYLAQNQFQNIHNVPDEVLRKMKARFEYDISELFEKYKI